MVDREALPVNEFEDNDMLLACAFPDVFFLGTRGVRRKGTMQPADTRHLLLQFSAACGSCPPLIFLLMNQVQRHAATAVLSAAVKDRPESLVELGAHIASPGFLNRLDAAIAEPNSAEAATIVALINKHLVTKAKKVPFGPSARSQSCATLYAYCMMYGLPSVRLDEGSGCICAHSHACGFVTRGRCCSAVLRCATVLLCCCYTA